MTAVGGPEVLKLQEISDPVPGKSDLLVRLKAASVNPLDWKMRGKGTRYPDRLPSILGVDGAGVIEAVGEKVTRFKKGDEVYFFHGGIGADPGTYAQFAVVNEMYAAKKPASIDFVEAGASPLVLITAWESFYDRALIHEGQQILIHAGAGGVGHVAIQLAKIAGCKVCTTVDTEEKADFVRSLGVDKAILFLKEDFVRATLDWTGGKGVDVALDTVGGETFAKTIDTVRYYGDLVTLLTPPANIDWKAAMVRNLRISFELTITPMTEGLEMAKRHHAAILEKCGHLFDQSKLRVHVYRTFPLEMVTEAHRLGETGTAMGKIVIEIN